MTNIVPSPPTDPPNALDGSKRWGINLWHIILNGDFPPLAKNEVTQILEVVPFEEQSDDLKKKLVKNNEAKMVLYNALPKKEYERIFMCKTAKDIWQSLLTTHQSNSQVKDNKIDLLVQQYEQFTILEEESIDSGFARFNTIITSLKAIDEGFSSKNYVRKFLRALHPKWIAKVTVIEESKYWSSLALDELIGNLKVHKVVMEKDCEIYKGKKERIKSIALKAKKESSDDETSTTESDDEEYAMAVRNFKNFFRRNGKFVRQPREEKKSFRQRDEKKGKSDRKCFRYGDPNHLYGDCPKPSRNKDQKAFIGGSWSDSENDAEDKTNDETCLMTQSSNEETLNSSCYSDNASSLDNDNMQIEYDSLCEISLKIINKNKILKTKRDLLEKENLKLNEKIKKLERSKEIEIACKSCDELKLENAKLNETQVKFVKLDKSTNSLREMLNNQKSPSFKISLGFDSDKASTSGTKTMSFVGSFAEKATDESTIKDHGSTLPGSVCLRTCLEPDEWIKDSGCSKHMTGNKSLFSTYKAYDGGYSQNSKAYVVLNKHTIKVEESLNVTFDESSPSTKLSPLVDDDVGEKEAIRKNNKIVNTNNEEDGLIELDEIVNIKESKNHPLDQVIRNLNQRTLSS
uniref:Zf-CCHC domain-containing protein/UBN2 domain-containing protein n=1 Tax=Tanacetum cinerariifolium TaxID=118510 RepID=A0A699GQ44_TANCI|nr:zf-CCHC domain-containing protein/UBN2 domain-containing protein [Tanacetum cinerariifolium]